MCPNKTKFNPNWLTRAAKNEDPISLYIQAIFEDRHRVKCTWCSSDFEIGSRGFLSIKTHSEQKKHVSTANIGQGRNNQKGVLTGHDKNNDLPAGEADQAGQGNDDPRLREGGEGGMGGGGGQRVFPVFAPRSRGGFTGVTGQVTGQAQPRTLQDKVVLARARYLLSAVENQISFSGVERQLKVLPKLSQSVLKKIYFLNLF